MNKNFSDTAKSRQFSPIRVLVPALLTAAIMLFLPAITALGSPFTQLPRIQAVDDFEFSSLEVDYYLDRDDEGHSTLTTIEHFVAVFPETDQNRGIRRMLPSQFNGWPTNLRVISVTDESGNARPMEVESDDGIVQVTSRASTFLHGEQHYVITYEQQNVTRYFENTSEEFYWDINGEDWAQPFGLVEARVHLDSELSAALVADAQFCYWGRFGSPNQCDIRQSSETSEGTTITASQANLGPRETVTIAIGFENGTFTPRNDGLFNTFTGMILSAMAALGAVILGILGFFLGTRLRNAKGRGTIIAQYEPPQNMSALFAGIFMGKLSHSVTAQLLDLAISGNIDIVEESKQGMFGSKTRYGIFLRELPTGYPEELAVLGIAFGRTPLIPGNTHWIGEDKSSSASTRMSKLLRQQSKEITRRGYRSNTHSGQKILLGILGVLMGIGLFIISLFNLVEQIAIPFAIGGVILAVAIVLFSTAVMTKTPLTREGAELKEYLAGLKLYIEVAEADRIRMLQSLEGAERGELIARLNRDSPQSDAPGNSYDFFDTRGQANPHQLVRLYERLLPYAIIFGQEKTWTKVLGDYYEQMHTQPTWYHGHTAFSAAAFGAAVGGLASSTSATFGSSSSSGGSSGGGSAGGGGGGGGGGGV